MSGSIIKYVFVFKNRFEDTIFRKQKRDDGLHINILNLVFTLLRYFALGNEESYQELYSSSKPHLHDGIPCKMKTNILALTA